MSSPRPQEEDGPGFSIRTLPEVVLDTSVTATERRYQTGMVPVALSTNTFDQGARLEERIAASTAYADCFVARPRADWVEFGPDGLARINEDLVAAVDYVRDHGVDCVVVEIDPVSDRRHVGVLPPELAGMNFADAPVRDPVKRMAIQIALRLKPAYLSIGVEMNGYYESNPDDYLNYIDLHKETYDAVKAAAPDVRFMASYNLEALQGYFGDLDEFSNHEPQWFIIDMMEPKLDAVAFSTLPFPLFISPVLIPDDYLSRIELHTSRDILFTEVGWPADPNPLGIHTEQSQAQYLAQMVRLLDDMNQVKVVVWTSLFDPDLGSPGDLNFDFQTLGLIDNNKRHKPSLEVWEALHALPYHP